MKEQKKKSKNIESIRKRIDTAKTGAIFVASDFVDITDKTNVNAYLARLVDEKLITRVFQGVYYKAEYNEFIKEYVAPSPNEVAYALSRNFGWSIVPSGDIALNILGISTQIPATWIYISDGVYRKYTYGNTTIQFKRTMNKEISKLSYKTALTVQALKALGKDQVDKTTINRLKTMFTDKEKETMLGESKIITAWVYEYIKQICGS